ncbi:dienelactone hydrolase family protein [Herbaspirillum sp. alder98]|uniref:dienelactone hydrolase family protein n=1 Tax=Herbaspirillum sp. alder98 TaxID=2913096 RepID=UPI001CD83B22|nr:dienelactone hydrolase family protein [Herbaspirillum sp. alder98]MCA1323384.1 dienelactone hydrolase family protein [Herbaspirillum sp. alder98]
MKKTMTHARSTWRALAHGMALVLCGLALHGTAQARLIEEQIDVPVKLRNVYGKAIEQPIRVTVWRDDANPVPAPVLVLNHGRAVDGQGRANVGRARFSVAARFFVAQGFIVAVPTRIGYGVTGGEDIEDSGSCNSKQYPPAYQIAADQTLAALTAVRALPNADQARSVIAGQSFGGTTAITVASLNFPGVSAAINFAGGGGGNPKTHPQRPCMPQMLEQMFGQYGKTARIPTLWIYTQNDQWMGPTYPREWFNAYRAAGGAGEFELYPPHGEDGHMLFAKFPEVWQPRVKQFLEQNGFVAPTRKGEAR